MRGSGVPRGIHRRVRPSLALTIAAHAACAPDAAYDARIERTARNVTATGDAGARVVDAGAAPGSDAATGDAGAVCQARPNTDPSDGDVNIDLTVEFQAIQGFGGINVPGWIPDLTAEQVDTAFGNGPGQLGLSILRVRIPYDPTQFALEAPSAAHAVQLGAKVIASPWTPPPALKSNANIVGGELNVESYGAYADHLLSFRDFMADSGVPLYAISVQNEPDIAVTYESCDWTPQQIASWLAEQGPRFGDTKLIAAESFNFNPNITDPILQHPVAVNEVDIIGGHIYGRPPSDYPLARSLGKELWMTEHFTSSNISANAWPNALAVGKEIHDCMSANFSAYIWWYLRRSYGPITEDGLVSKRGYLMAQYAKFIRPGFVRVAATAPAAPDVYTTAYKGDGASGAARLVVVAVNTSADPRDITLDADGSCVESFARYTTSATKNVADDGTVLLSGGRAAVTLEGQSVTSFVSN
jgi:glucuronoarabinoxylan endo-1,4-beta-xylanase